MLIIISDLHLTDGTTNENISADAFRLFAARLRDLAERASQRPDGNYQPINSITLLLLGDIFDYLHSVRWLDEKPGQPGFARPWDDPQSPALSAKIDAITDGILKHNAEALAILKKISQGQAVSIPVARPVGGRIQRRRPLPVQIFYMAGNHDWYLHLPGAAYEAIRQKIITAIGLANPPQPFPHQLSELPALQQICRAHAVYAQHGDMYEPVNYDKTKGRNAATLGDAIGIELIDRYPLEIQSHMGASLPVGFIADLREIVNVRPALLAAVWLENLLRRYALSAEQAKEVKRIWNRLTDDFLHNSFVRSLDKPRALDKIDALEAVLKLTQKTPLQFISDTATFVTQLLWGGDISYARHALGEPAFLDYSARFIVYGHTHHHEIVPLDIYQANGQSLSRLCFNTGTWHPLHEMACRNPNEAEFISQQVMTYLAFFTADERHGRPYESWSGALAWR